MVEVGVEEETVCEYESRWWLRREGGAMVRLQFGAVGCSCRLHTAKGAPAKCSADNVSHHPSVAQARVGTRNGPLPNVQTAPSPDAEIHDATGNLRAPGALDETVTTSKGGRHGRLVNAK
jgi:hypothetical protein